MGPRSAARWRFLVAVLGRLATIGLVALSVALTLRHVVLSPDRILVPFDWIQFELATQKLDGSSLYVWEYQGSFEYSYRYSPLFAYVMVPFVALGLTIWRLLHLAVLVFLPWRVVLITLIAWPFWEDVNHGNVMTFALVFGWLAIAGSRWATGAYFALALLVPRPLMLPLFVWLLWRRPEWRLPVVAMTVAFAALTLATGEADAFVGALLRSDDMLGFPRNFGPSRWLGLWWLVIGIPLAAWLTWKHRVGWASLAVSPYLLPYHFIMVLLESAPLPGRNPPGEPLMTTLVGLGQRWVHRARPSEAPSAGLAPSRWELVPGPVGAGAPIPRGLRGGTAGARTGTAPAPPTRPCP
jgi:hypothetical protein